MCVCVRACVVLCVHAHSRPFSSICEGTCLLRTKCKKKAKESYSVCSYLSKVWVRLNQIICCRWEAANLLKGTDPPEQLELTTSSMQAVGGGAVRCVCVCVCVCVSKPLCLPISIRDLRP